MFIFNTILTILNFLIEFFNNNVIVSALNSTQIEHIDYRIYDSLTDQAITHKNFDLYNNKCFVIIILVILQYYYVHTSGFSQIICNRKNVANFHLTILL